MIAFELRGATRYPLVRCDLCGRQVRTREAKERGDHLRDGVVFWDPQGDDGNYQLAHKGCWLAQEQELGRKLYWDSLEKFLSDLAFNTGSSPAGVLEGSA